MKKYIILFLLTYFSNSNIAKSQIALETNTIIETYIGGPNFARLFSAPNYVNTSTVINQTTSIPIIGLKAEFFVGDRIGVGANIYYNTLTINYTNCYYQSNIDFSQELITENISKRMDRLRIIAYFNYHFNLNNPNIDLYWGLGAGYNSKKFNYTLNNKRFDETRDESRPLIILPFTARTYIGFRYFPVDNIGINTEFGVGGPLVSAGISFRIVNY